MTDLHRRRSNSVDHRSTKRRKPNGDQTSIYSTRDITWAEQLTLPPRFHQEKNVWPALKILEERGVGKKKEYLLEWEPHPKTGEIFQPTWEPVDNVGQKLKREWKRVESLRSSPPDAQQSSSAVSTRSTAPSIPPKLLANTRRQNSRRIIPDSSAEGIEDIAINTSVGSRTPTLTGSPGSADSVVSPIEISETQHQTVRVNVPPAPSDKTDWESFQGSQLSAVEASNHRSSSLPAHSLNSNTRRQRRPPISNTEVLNSPDSLTSPSVRSSPRLRASLRRDQGRGPRRILNYQPDTQVQSSSQASIPSSQLSAQQSESIALVHGSSQQADLAGPALVEPSDDLNSRAASQRKSRNLQDNSAVKRRPDLSRISTQPSSKQGTQPWVFKSQISFRSQLSLADSPIENTDRTSLSGPSVRQRIFNSSPQQPRVSFASGQASTDNNRQAARPGMAARNTRQSPRLQTVNPVTGVTAPRIAVRTNSYRTRSNFNPPEHSSPLAATAELADSERNSMPQDFADSSFIDKMAPEQPSSNLSIAPPTSIAPSAMHIDPMDPTLMGALSQASQGSVALDLGVVTATTPIQDSIEEVMSPAEDASLESKASSSQESLRNETFVPRVDGLVMPSYPILGDDEYAIGLPAEGKVQAIYTQTIKVKRKAILKFIRQRGSVNTAGTSATKTIVRNEMIELIGRLHDTTTHIDLGLPGIPTQYTIASQEHAAYAEYAGSKFVFLGDLIEYFKRRECTIVIMAKSGATQDLLEEYLVLKKVKVRRHERAYHSQQDPQSQTTDPTVEIISTRPTDIVTIDSKPDLIIAFDASFDTSDPQVKSLRAQSTEIVPVIHLLVTNSSEHVERCLPVSMPSPIRLRLLVRATFQAQMNLGGNPTIIHKPSDEIEGRPMDLGDISRAVRKSPNRKLEMIAAVVANATLSEDFAANWTLPPLPELVLEELDESPATESTVSTTPGRSRARSRTPFSRAGTPSSRKRQLELDSSELATKRQRTTPNNELAEPHEADLALSREQELQRIVDSLRIDLANERRAREAAEQARLAAEKKAGEWQNSLAGLQRRYEKRTAKSHQQQKTNKLLATAVENTKQRSERLTTENANLRQQISQQKKELETARNDLKATGGDVAVLEAAREEARDAVKKVSYLEKSLESTKRDFDFVRSQYQDASNRAAELGSQNTELEAQVKTLSGQAGDEKRRLREINHSNNIKQHLAKISQLEAEKKSIQVMYKKVEDENKLLKRNRGVQTRGSSTAPGSPGPRSRQGSPALGPPSGSRASVLRHERV